MKYYLIALLTLVFCTSAYAKDGLVLGLGAGKGELQLDEGSNFPNADTCLLYTSDAADEEDDADIGDYDVASVVFELTL